jgi:hypothetical protein
MSQPVLVNVLVHVLVRLLVHVLVNVLVHVLVHVPGRATWILPLFDCAIRPNIKHEGQKARVLIFCMILLHAMSTVLFVVRWYVNGMQPMW